MLVFSWLNKVVWFTGFPVNVVKTEDLRKTELKNKSEISNLPIPRPPPFQNTVATPDTTCFGTK